MLKVFSIAFLLFCSLAFGDNLPISGIQIEEQKDWQEYSALKMFAEQPFEKVWINKSTSAIRMVSAVFSDPKKVCSSEMWSLEKKNFVAVDLKSIKGSGLTCAFSASRGAEKFIVGVKNVVRKLPNGKNFVSQAVFVERNGSVPSFSRWIASVKPLKIGNKK